MQCIAVSLLIRLHVPLSAFFILAMLSVLVLRVSLSGRALVLCIEPAWPSRPLRAIDP